MEKALFLSPCARAKVQRRALTYTDISTFFRSKFLVVDASIQHMLTMFPGINVSYSEIDKY